MLMDLKLKFCLTFQLKICHFFRAAKATLSKYNWVLKAYNQWRDYRLDLYNNRKTMEVTQQNCMTVPILEAAMDFDKLSADVCDFIIEVHKENGKDYPPGTLYDLVASLSSYIAHEMPDLNMKLLSDTFKHVKNTLDTTMAE